MVTIIQRSLRNTLKFGTTEEVNSKEGVAPFKGIELAPPESSEVRTPQVKLDGTVGEALITKPQLQSPRKKLIFDIFFDDQFLTD